MAVDIEGIRRAIQEDRYEWRLHVLVRLAERGISQQEILDTLVAGECIREYPEDRPYPSALFLGKPQSDRPLHVVASYFRDEQKCYIITCYVPDTEHYEDDWKTRKK